MVKVISHEATCSLVAFESNDSLSRRSLHFLKDLEAWRSEARLQWYRAIDRHDGLIHPKIPRHLPDYFVDRYGFRLYLASLFGQDQETVSVPDYDLEEASQIWYDALRQKFSALPNHHLQTPSLQAKIPPSDFRTGLFQAWRDYIESLGIEERGNFGKDPENLCWFEYFQNSCHFPKRPALSGPDYFYRLSANQQEFLIQEYGALGVMDFFIFMQQVHEESHIQQRGEPLLSEFIHAWLWCDFLKRNNLDIFQINHETRFSCNLERAWVTQLEFTPLEVKGFFEDTHEGSRAYFFNDVAYVNICLVAFLFDKRKMRYVKYLDWMLKIFLHSNSVAWQNNVNEELFGSVKTCFKKNTTKISTDVVLPI
jgi:hypothetical protein